MNHHFDVVVVGAGMVGASLAALLNRDPRSRGLSLGLLDARAPEPLATDGPYALRVSALSRASQNILATAGAWPSIAAARVFAYQEMRVWDANADDSDDPLTDGLHFDSAVLGEPDLGHIVENGLVQSSLHDLLARAQGIEMLLGVSLKDVAFEADRLVLATDAGHTLTTGLLIGCDGGASPVRQLAGIEADTAAYDQLGIVAIVRTEKPHGATAWQRFLPSGPVAFLPLASGECSIVWSCENERARQLMALNEEDFAAALTRASNKALGHIQLVSRRGSFPLRRLLARHYCRERLVLAGDAAHVVHPLAGQGANLGLLDAAALAQVLAEALANGEAPGDLRVLRRYERWRKGDNLAMLAALDGLSKLFGSTRLPLGKFRRAGLSLVNRAQPARNRLARQALGLAGELPEAALGRLGTGVRAGFA